ncbi:hypothetical protein [Nocardia sp. BMG51109]|uniref:hypothetical protein n=1 Tax=Nocardia sp. BMG51109 TaxID=1056816 RepID=UPI000466336E|nr:hypothetical protein [Nocardia sp. BMG51109]
MTSNSNNGNHGIDWDGELQTLMEASGIDPAQLARPAWPVRLRRKVFGARAAVCAAGVAVPLMWLVVSSGAPVAAVVPLVVWLAGWIGYGVWLSMGRPDWSIAASTAREAGTAGFHAGSRFAFARSRPLRARWRAIKADRARDGGVSDPASA